MATDEREPLLLEENDDSQSSKSQLRDLIASDPRRSAQCRYRASGGGMVDVSTSASVQNLHLQEADHICAIFVVAFDTKAGEWAGLFKWHMVTSQLSHDNGLVVM